MGGYFFLRLVIMKTMIAVMITMTRTSPWPNKTANISIMSPDILFFYQVMTLKSG